MKSIFAVWLLIWLPSGLQIEPHQKKAAANQQAKQANGGVALVQNEGQPHQNTKSANAQQQPAVKAPMPQQGYAESAWVWFKSRSNDNWLLFVTVLYLLATVGIFKQMVRQNNHAEKIYETSANETQQSLELTRQGLKQTANSVAAATEQVAALKNLVAVAREDQRAWVGFVKIQSRPFVVGNRLQVGVDIRNTGKTPARGTVKMRVSIMPEWEAPELADAPWLPSTIRSLAMLFPGALSSASNYARDENEPILLTPDLLFQINTGALKVFVDGRIDYSDVFGVDHWAEFRSVWNPADRVFTQCEKGNSTDDKWG